MNEEMLRQQVQSAVQQHCARLQPDPLLAQRVLLAADKKETVHVKKTHVGLILAFVLMMLTVTAVAVALLTGMEVIEQTAIPLAQQNDGEALRPNETYSAEELQQLIRVAAENGITLDDDTSIMRALRKGEGYNEEEAIMAICREAFGGLYYEWTVEQRHWFEEMMILIGFDTENSIALPGPDDLPSAEARQLARETVLKHYPEAAINDPALYRVEEDFSPENGQTDGAWFFHFYPKTLQGNTYFVEMDRQGEWVNVLQTVRDMTDYTERTLMQAITETYSYRSRSQLKWTAEVWTIFRDMLENAVHSDKWDVEYDAYMLTAYALPEEGDMDEQAVRDVVFAHLGDSHEDTLRAAVLLDIDGRHVWRITLSSLNGLGIMDENCYLEVDAKTGEIISESRELVSRPQWASFVPESVYHQLVHITVSGEEALALAVQALQAETGRTDIDFLDETLFTRGVSAPSNNREDYTIRFRSQVMEYGHCSVSVSSKTRVTTVNNADLAPLSADNLFERFQNPHGTCYDWPQSTWAAFSREMEKYDNATTFDAKLFKLTRYVEEDTVKINRDEAIDLACLDIGDRTRRATYGMLIDAEPNPVWKLRMDAFPLEILYEIDAMTGEVLNTELYACQMGNFDHDMMFMTLRSTFKPLYLQEYGAKRLAMEYAVKANHAPFYEAGDEAIYLNEEVCYIHEDGLVVTFCTLKQRIPGYRVTLSEDGMTADIQPIDVETVRAVCADAPEGSTAWKVSQYGMDRSLWPASAQEGAPNPGEMSREEAIEYAKKYLAGQIGQEAYDALGETVVWVEIYRYENRGPVTRFHVSIANKASTAGVGSIPVGYTVVFFQQNGEITSPYYKDINDAGNG